jgi:hypothetical protein
MIFQNPKSGITEDIAPVDLGEADPVCRLKGIDMNHRFKQYHQYHDILDPIALLGT